MGSKGATVDHLPRLFVVTDPLAVIGLVVEAPAASGTQHSFGFFDDNEEIIHMSQFNESAGVQSCEAASLAVTTNRLKRTFTVWQMSYMDVKPVSHRHHPHAVHVPSSRSRRRSSFDPGVTAERSTPKIRNPSGNLAASFSGAVPQPASHAKPPRLSAVNRLESGLEALSNEELQNKHDLPGRKVEGNRRTSSILARTELINVDNGAINDFAMNPAGVSQNSTSSFRKRQSVGAVGNRQSQGRLRQSMRASTPGSVSALSDNDVTMHQDGTTGLWGDLESEDECEDLSSLQRRAVMTRITSVPMELSTASDLNNGQAKHERVTVLILQAAPRSSDPVDAHHRLNVLIHDKQSRVILDVTLVACVSASKGEIARSTEHTFDHRLQMQPPANGFEWRKTGEIMSVAKVADGSLCRVGILHEHDASRVRLSVVSDWDGLRRDNLGRTSFVTMAKTLPQVISVAVSQEKSVLPMGTVALTNVGLFGQCGLVNQTGDVHKVQIRLRPESDIISKILSATRILVSGTCPAKDDIMSIWWRMCRECKNMPGDSEWHALVVAIFCYLAPPIDAKLASALQGNGQSGQLNGFAAGHVLSEDRRTAAVWTTIQSRFRRSAHSRLPSNEKALLITSCVEIAQKYQHQIGTTRIPNHTERSQLLPATHLMLHVLREEESLNSLSPHQTHATRLAEIMVQTADWLNWPDGVSPFYSTHSIPWFVKGWIQGAYVQEKVADFAPLTELQAHPYYTSLRHRESLFISGNRHSLAGLQIAPRIQAVTMFMKNIRTGLTNPSTLVSAIIDNGISLHLLETLPEFVALSLRWFILKSRIQPPTTWPRKVLDFAGRQDLSMLLRVNKGSESSRPSEAEVETPIKDMHTICQQAAQAAPLYQSNLSAAPPPMVFIFREDKRATEAQKLLNPLRVAVAEIVPREGSSEADFLEDQRRLAQLVYKRTMAIPAGQAVMEFCTYQPLLTENITVSSFNTSCNMQPSNTTVNADRSNFTEEKVCWAFFHAGVNAGLRIVRDAPGIDTSWLILNKPQDLGNRHAGFLLALGLNGHLKSIAKWLAFKYLTPKHNITSIGLLLGLAASHIGTMNSLVTRLLSVHVTCLLPPGAAELNLSPLTQTAAIMGIGLLYFNSQHRRMTEVLLSEIEFAELEDPTDPPDSFKNEGYRLAAGFSLGLVSVGAGNDLQSLHDLRIVERLLSVATGPRDIELVQVLDQATAGAVVATALIFLKTGNKAVAKKINVPNTVQQYDYVRSDILLLRVVARNLIMWDDVQPSLEWIRKSMPSAYRSTTPELTLSRMTSKKPLDSKKLPFYNILAGFCWSVSLKFSGSGNVAARNVCLYYLDRIGALLAVPCATYDNTLTRNALLRIVHLLALCAASVMAGTGDIVTFRRLRAMHAALQLDITFGLHQATHTAIGILFLGQGRYSFTTSNLSIASLMCAFYPIFAQDVLDNRAHLQAFRHLWTFATEARCIMTKDAETGRPIVTPIKVVLRDGTVIESVHNDGLRPPNQGVYYAPLMAPCLLPQLDTVAQVMTTSAEYWQVTLDFANNAQHLERFRKDQTIYLRRKSVIEQHESAFDVSLALAEDPGSAPGKSKSGKAFEWAFDLPLFRELGVGRADALSVMPTADVAEEAAEDGALQPPLHALLSTRTTNIDDLLVFSSGTKSYGKGGDEDGSLDLLFKWADVEREEGKALWITEEMLEALKRKIVVEER